MKHSNEEIKTCFERDTKNHKMEVLQDEGVYRHLKFTNNGSQCYRFDLHTWPGSLCIDGDMGTYVFRRVQDMFNFFIMDKHDFNHKHVINPGYWGEKLQATDGRDGKSYTEFSMDVFKENVMSEYDGFREQYMISEDMYDDESDEHMAEAYEEDKQPLREMFDQLLGELTDDVLHCDENEVRAYDAAMDFSWKSDDGEFKFDMNDFWDHNNTAYTYHYIWILYAIVWGITEYNNNKDKEPTPPPGEDRKEGVQPA